MKNRCMASAVMSCCMCSCSYAQLSGIYVEFYNPTAPFNVAPDGWQTVPGYPCRHGPDPDNDGIPSSIGTPEPGLSSGSNISLSSVNSVNYRIFAVSPTTTDIGNVTVSGSSAVPTLFIGRPAIGFPVASPFARLPSAGSRNLGRISQSGVNLKLQGFIEGTLNNTITAHEIVRFDFGTPTSSGTGTIAANITHNPSADPTVTQLGGIFAKRVANGANITSFNSNIRVLQTYVDFEGSIQTTAGKDIKTFIVGRDFRDAGLNVAGTIEFLQISRDGTGSIVVAGDMQLASIAGDWGALPVGATPNYQSSSISVGGSISTRLTVGGDFVGELSANDAVEVSIGGGFYDHVSGSNIIGAISITEDIGTLSIGVPTLGTANGIMVDLDANTVTNEVIFSGNFAAGSALLRDGLPSGSLFSIGQSLAAGVVIELENNQLDPNDVGLEGQIIINQEDGAGTWSGTVQIDDGSTVTSLAPNYNALPATLGGGAIGQVPFNFHANASTPKPITTKLFAGTRETVTIEHYGPVFRPESEESNAPLLIEFVASLDCTSGTGWTTVASSNFTFVIEDDEQTFDRTITITPAGSYQWVEGFYRMSPVADVLKCAWVDGNPDLGDYVYTSTLFAASGINDHFPVHVINGIGGMLLAMDMDESGWVDSPDAAAWINDPQDFDGDEIADANDLMMLVLHYGQQVPE